MSHPRSSKRCYPPIAAVLLLLALFAALPGCPGPSWIAQGFKKKTDAIYKIANRPTVIVVDDPAGQFNNPVLKSVIASQAGFLLKQDHAVTNVISRTKAVVSPTRRGIFSCRSVFSNCRASVSDATFEAFRRNALQYLGGSALSRISLPRKRDAESPPKCHWKILRMRNRSAVITADVSTDENERCFEDDGRDPLLRSASATDT
jgi:hypothetical protein